MGKKPFSAKAKREQLRRKRQASANPSVTPSSPSSANSSRNRKPSSSAPSHQTPSQRYKLTFAADTEQSRMQARALAHAPISTHAQARLADRTMSISSVRPYPDPRFAMPRRPPWKYSDTLAELEARELEAFRTWMRSVQRNDPSAAYFEQNIETWRQLWRVIERSDVLVLVADIRFPALHFVPDLYYYVTDDLKKGMVLALNKCDLVPADVLLAWKKYFEENYPGMAIALFSSFPDAKLAPSEENSELLSKRERRMARSKLSAWGADQLLAAVDSLKLDPKKKAYLGEWRARLDGHAGSSDEDEDGADLSFLHETLRRSETHGQTGAKDDNGQLFIDRAQKENATETRGKAQRKRRRRPKNAKTEGAERKAVLNKAEESGSESHESDSKSELDEDSVRENMITIGIVGHPNAGKSSMINGVFRKKVVSTSRTPGHTKHLQTIFLSESVRLCDCPGLVFPGFAPRELQILAGMYPIAQVREPYAAIKYLAERVALVETLKLESELGKLEELKEEGHLDEKGWTAWKICEAWAMKRGFRTAKAARLDVFRAANSILRLALDGRVVLATVPEGFNGRYEVGDGETLDVADDLEASVLGASKQVWAVLAGDEYESSGEESWEEEAGVETTRSNGFSLLQELGV